MTAMQWTGRRKTGQRSQRFSGFVVALMTSCLLASSSTAKTPSPGLRYSGINLAGAAFAPERVPGTLGTDYIYPDRAVAQPFVDQGFDTVRLSILWERIQPEPFKPLSEVEMARMDASMKDLDGFRTILLDVHNYGRYKNQRLDEAPRGAAMLADLWVRLANRYAMSPNVAFGIMNEPYDIDAWAWREIVDKVVVAIRRTGARNLLLIPGTRWTGAHNWLEGGESSNAAAFQDFQDPGDNFLFELHQYFDADSSGTTDGCVNADIGSQRLMNVTRWLRERKARALLGEFGAAPSPTCLAALKNTLVYMNANPDIWVGWTYWAGGAWWGDYKMSIQPVDGQDRPQTAVLLRHMAR